jgi:hypothetical protein
VERCKKLIACQGRYLEKEIIIAPLQIPTRSNKVSPRILQTAVVHNISVRKPHGKSQLVKPRRRWEDNIISVVRETVFRDINLIE